MLELCRRGLRVMAERKGCESLSLTVHLMELITGLDNRLTWK